MTEPPNETVVCEKCGATNPRRALRCASCSDILPAGKIDPAARATVKTNIRIESDEPQTTQFTLTSLMLVLTLVSICFALIAQAPGLGITIAIATVPAFIRTALLAQRRQVMARPLSSSDKIFSFLSSLGVVVIASMVTSVAACITFFITCLLAMETGARDEAIVPATACVVGVSLVLFYLFFRWARYRWHRDLWK